MLNKLKLDTQLLRVFKFINLTRLKMQQKEVPELLLLLRLNMRKLFLLLKFMSSSLSLVPSLLVKRLKNARKIQSNKTRTFLKFYLEKKLFSQELTFARGLTVRPTMSPCVSGGNSSSSSSDTLNSGVIELTLRVEITCGDRKNPEFHRESDSSANFLLSSPRS